MPLTSERTRFLADLDKMIAQDPRGAIADMLTVLRERGAVRTVNAKARGDVEYLKHANFDSYLRRRATDDIAHLLLDEQRITFSSETVKHETAPWREMHQVTGALDVVIAK